MDFNTTIIVSECYKRQITNYMLAINDKNKLIWFCPMLFDKSVSSTLIDFSDHYSGQDLQVQRKTGVQNVIIFLVHLSM